MQRFVEAIRLFEQSAAIAQRLAIIGLYPQCLVIGGQRRIYLAEISSGRRTYARCGTRPGPCLGIVAHGEEIAGSSSFPSALRANNSETSTPREFRP